MSVKKERIDVLMVQQGLAPGRDNAKRLIMSGIVYVNGEKCDKAGQTVPEDAQIEVRGSTCPFVSRGGKKLAKAVEVFSLSLSDFVCMDIGASTGGFTDCMLQNGAAKVYAVDVGYGQLAWKLRSDPRVVNLERTNIRYLSEESVTEPIDFFSVDVSFISLSHVFPVAERFTGENGAGVCLIKPQFEAGREKVGKKGVVRDPKVHLEVIEKILDLVKQTSFTVMGLDFSPIKGPEGNIEYLLYLKKGGQAAEIDPQGVVDRAHQTLDTGKEVLE